TSLGGDPGNPNGTSHIGSLLITSSGSIGSPPPNGYSGPQKSYFGTLDLANNDLIIDGTNSLAEVNDMIRAGQGGTPTLNWSGTNKGITSSYAASGPLFGATGLGAIRNDTNPSTATPDSPTNLFGGVTLAAPTGSEIFVKYTWYGDLNLDGVVSAL